jgi:RHS repeat-associated protein
VGLRKLWVVVTLAAVIAVGLPVLPFVSAPAASADPPPSPYRAAVLADSPHAYVPFDETSGTTAADASGNGRNAVYNGTVTLGASGPLTGEAVNRAASFGGSGQHASFGSALVQPSGDWTVEAWVFVNGSGFGDGNPIWSQYHDSFSTRVTAQAGCGAIPCSVIFQIGDDLVTASGQLPVATWRHVAWRRTGSTVDVFVDSLWKASMTTSRSVDTDVTWVGGHSGAFSTAYFNGRVAHFAVYRTALSMSRLRAHYSASGRTVAVPSAQARGRGRHGQRTTTRRADPVDTATGAFVDQVTDLAVPGTGAPFAFTRTYNSNDPTVGALGKGWTHSWAASLTVAGSGDVTVRTEDGAELAFTPDGVGGFVRPPAVTSTLASVSGGYELIRADQARYRFDTAGRLLSVKDRSDQGVDLAYDGSNRLATATDAAERVFTFTYNAAGRISTLATPAADGRSVSYGYSGELLTSVTDVRGGVTAYAYDASSLLRQVTDPEGNLEVRNTYDGSGRAIEQLDPLGGTTTFAWDAATQTSTMTDPKGKTWVDVYSGNVLVSTTEPSGMASATFDGDLNPAAGTDARGNTWSATHDSRGNLLTRTAPVPLSYVESWTYDAANNPLTYTDGRGNTTTYAYDASGRLTTTTWAGGATETRAYTAAGQLATLSDARSNTTTYAYDASGNLTSVTSPTGSATSWTYDTAGRPLTRTEPRGNAAGATPSDHTTTWTYNAAGNVLTETDALGRTTTSTYDGNGKALTRTDPAGRVTSYAYNGAGEPTSETAPGGLVTTSGYDSRGQLVIVTSPAGAVTTYAYDDAGRVASMVEPRGNAAGATPADYRWSYGYDANGNQTTVTDPLGNTTTRAYDALNRLTSVTDASGHATTYGYDANSNRTSQANHLGQTTTWAYDARNRVASMTNPLGKTWTHGYDANGNQTSETTPLGSNTTRSYDAANRLVAVVDPLGNAPGGVPAAHRTTYAYDPDGNQTTETDPLGATTTFAYDRVGNQASRTDANGHATTWGFDALNRLVSVTAPASGTTAYAYDTAGNLTARTDAHSHVTTYGFDADHRLTSLTSPTGQHWTYGYDAAGNRTTTTDAKANAAGVPALGTITASYDRAGRLVGIDYSDATPDATFAYDAAGNRTTMTDGVGTETRTYDAADRLTSVTRGTNTFTFAYNTAGRVTSRSYPDGTVTTLGFDDDGQLVTVSAPEGTTAYTWDVAGRMATTTLPNGIVETRTHDNAHRVAAIADTKGAATVASFAYARDPVGNPTQVVAATGTQTYGYDAADRLTSVCYAASCAAGSLDLTTWTYDQVGNRLTQATGPATRSYAYDAADQLTQSSLAGVTTPYAYDPNGNQTAAGLDTFTYDLAGRMTSAADAALPATYAYTYDGDGKRVRTTTTTPLGTTVANDAWDVTQPVPEVAVERDGAGGVTRRYGYGLDRISTTAGGAASFYLHDALGSVANLTSAGGTKQWTYTYTPFGRTGTTTHDDPTAVDQPMRFTGEHLDATGLYHLRARQYDPTTGRFATTDPVAPDITDPYVSAYVYANGRPTALTDPTGEKGRKPTSAFVGPPKAPILAPVLVGGSVAGRLLGGIVGAVLGDVVFPEAAGDPNETATCVYCEGGPKYLWRGGSDSHANLTPRPESDTRGWPQNGLSTYLTKRKACVRQTKAQRLSVARLWAIPGLNLQHDYRDPLHVFLQGDTKALHLEWAASRKTADSDPHRLTLGVALAFEGPEACP